MKGYKNMFEIWKAGKLPKKMQEHIDTCFKQGCETSEEVGYFKAGFMCALRLDEYKKEHADDDE